MTPIKYGLLSVLLINRIYKSGFIRYNCFRHELINTGKFGQNVFYER